MENGILVERKYLPDPDAVEPNPVAKWQAKTINEYFFFNDLGFLDTTEESVVDTYKSYQCVLKYAYDQLKKNYLNLINKSASKQDFPMQILGNPSNPLMPSEIPEMKTNSFNSYLTKE